MELEIVPMSISDARHWVDQTHRHHRAPQGGLFALGLARDGVVVGAAIVGRPVARGNWDGWTAEVTRVAVIEGVGNGCSKLYGASWRAARAMGYRRLITYTLASESGTSLVAAGFRVVGEVQGRSWHTPSRPRVDRHPLQAKLRWEMTASDWQDDAAANGRGVGHAAPGQPAQAGSYHRRDVIAEALG